ncbi:NAD(P)/FAD-dependent oxidoreductase [Nesterenkonia massiliensis]|uniref:NAD(P)/FAD-dependent oxidoreductase n=1 Tax=Nesterenkonia massiliensis TaxID=1232429 RepID=UPI000426F27F|nr:NAD(P)/FAD-dependent oxidoreductase [Nesterenkonia massiliensis]
MSSPSAPVSPDCAPVTLRSNRDEYRLGEMGPLYEHGAQEAIAAGVDLQLGTRYLGKVSDHTYLIRNDAGRTRIQAQYIVGADGARSQVARDLGLDLNTHLLVGAERVYTVTSAPAEPAFHCVIDPSIAPGYLAWVINDGVHAHIGTAGYARRYRHGIQQALETFSRTAPGLEHQDRHPQQVEKRGGPIPVGGLLPRISCPGGLLVGDAAGAVSPLTAGGLDPCLRLSDHAVEILDSALTQSEPDLLRHYDGATLRRKFRGRLAMRHAFAQLRSPTMAAAAFTGLRTRPGRAAAKRILFSDKSFPTPPTPQDSFGIRPAAPTTVGA